MNAITNPEGKADGADNGHSRCLFCGDQNSRSLGRCFEAEEDGSVKGRFQAGDELQGYDDVIHGGVIAGLLDAAMTHCLFHQGVQAMTGDLHVRFVKPVAARALLEIRAWVSFCSPPLYRLKAEVLVGESLMAWGEAKFMLRRRSY
jgi:acyl-coenzyme A thioesterase PaaI-like protein